MYKKGDLYFILEVILLCLDKKSKDKKYYLSLASTHKSLKNIFLSCSFVHEKSLTKL